MCKKTSRGNSSAEAVRGIDPNTAGPGGGSPGTGSPFPTGTAPLFGIPEFLPDVTFIATPTPNDNGFIGNAEIFHRNSGLNPISLQSFEQLVELLNDSAQTRTGVINHLRVVSHFFVDDENPGFTPSNIKIAMLNNSGRGILKHHFEGWAQSNYEGLKAMVSILTVSGTTLTLHPGVYADSLSRILNQLRPAQNAIINLIPTDGISGEPTGLHKDFVTFAASKWALTRFPSIINNTAARNAAIAAYDILLTHLKTQIGSPTSGQMTTLENAMVALPDWGSFTNVSPSNTAYFTANANAGMAAFSSNFFAKITTMRQRFNQFSTVDIRGCQAGRDLDYLRAIRQFFGSSPTVRPKVTAPDRFQRFNGLNQITGVHSQNAVDGLFNSGISPFNATELRNQFNQWADAYGITQAHLDFWKTTFSLHVLEFCKLQWRTNIPQPNARSARLDALPTANFRDCISKLADIFFFTTAQKPTNVQLNAIDPLLTNLTAWTNALNATIPDSANEATLTQHFRTFKGIYENVEPRTAQSSFSPRIIPATAPTTLAVDQVRLWQQQLKTFIDTDSHSVFFPIKRFIQAGFAQANAQQSKLRYFLRLGFVFQLYHATSTNFNHQIIIAFEDSGSANRRQDEAIRHWIRSYWRGTSPPNIPASITWENGRNAAWIVEGRTQGPSYICPQTAYDQHIIKLEASAP